MWPANRKATRAAKTVGSTDSDRVRMLVLETDLVFDSTAERKGTCGQIFYDLFAKAGAEHDPKIEIQTTMRFIVESEGGKIPEMSDLDNIQAILITGSKYDAHGSDEWILKLLKWIQHVWQTYPEIRFSGVCFGHQILCRALGSTVEPTKGSKWELSYTAINLTSLGEELFQRKSPIHLHQMHQDHVINAPSSNTSKLLMDDEEVYIWGSSDTTPIQGVYLKDRLFTSQGHLGYDEKMVRKHVEHRNEKGLVENDTKVEEAIEKSGWKHDGQVVANSILRFFHGDDRELS